MRVEQARTCLIWHFILTYAAPTAPYVLQGHVPRDRALAVQSINFAYCGLVTLCCTCSACVHCEAAGL